MKKSAIIIFFGFIAVGITAAAEHGQACSQTDDCNQEKHLECITGTCECKEDLHFDSVNCVIKPNGNCSTTAPSPNPECTANSKCLLEDDVLSCKCDAGFITNSPDDTACIKPWFGQDCNATFLCDTTLHLQCMEDKCACDTDYAEDETSTFCQPTYGQECNNETVENHCASTQFVECGDENKCVCLPTYVHDHDSNKCAIGAGEVCNTDGSLGECIGNSTCEAEGEKVVCKCGANLIPRDHQCVNAVGRIAGQGFLLAIVAVFAVFYV